MLKNILKLEGTHQLKKEQQTTIKGGIRIFCSRNSDCPWLWPVCSDNGHCISA
ncbi:hypothetical protein [Tenacibaculum agarivorans]|uniref:hypothetical protein n=1 Tax=Tenacibaculum agarivorans TaxID=1908389 RepID=UPI000B2E4444|nr:hypothetical protein [Tenacibaculum agarivorans]